MSLVGIKGTKEAKTSIIKSLDKYNHNNKSDT
jgi:hypothetical protein